jgi:hypothetical protein
MDNTDLENELSNLIDTAEQKCLSVYEYLGTAEGQIAMGGDYVLLVMSYAFVNFLALNSSMLQPEASKKVAIYEAVAAGRMALVQLNDANDYINQGYTIITSLPAFFEGFSMSVQAIKDVMQTLGVPQADIDNLPDQTVILAQAAQIMQTTGQNIANSNPGGNTGGTFRLSIDELLSVVFGDVYHFADSSALKMYYVDTAFSEIINTKEIVPPDTSAILLLHCYNANTEYLVWTWPVSTVDEFCRCLIQKNNETLTDFTSVFHSVPQNSYCDAYIDADDNLIWVAAADYYDDSDVETIIMASYQNGDVTTSKTYTFAGVQAAMNTKLNDLLTAAATAVSVVFSNSNTTTTTQSAFLRKDVLDGPIIVYENKYEGTSFTINNNSTFDGSGYVPDLSSMDAILGALYVGQSNVQAGFSNNTIDYLTGVLTVGGNNVIVITPLVFLSQFYKASGSVVAEILLPSSWSLSTSETQQVTAETIVLEKTTEGDLSGSVLSANSNSNFVVGFSVSVDNSVFDVDTCVITFTSGKNEGQTAIITRCYKTDMNQYITVINSSLPNIPVAGDFFSIDVYFGIATTTTTKSDITMSVNIESFQTGTTGETVNDLGDGYTEVTTTATINEYGTIDPITPTIQYSGSTIFTGSQGDYLTNGAWMTQSGTLVGLYEGKLIQASGETESANTINISLGNVVTKRFV